MTILFPDDTARARRSDPETSHEAADSNNVAESQHEVRTILEKYGPLADYDIDSFHRLRARELDIPPYSDSRLRTARSELVQQGHVEWTGEHDQTLKKRRTRTWRIRPLLRVQCDGERDYDVDTGDGLVAIVRDCMFSGVVNVTHSPDSGLIRWTCPACDHENEQPHPDQKDAA